MSAQILSGKELSAEIREQLKERVAGLKKDKGIIPGLAVIQVGEDGGSTIYVNNKEKACAEVGIYSEVNRLPEETTQDELLAMVEQYNNNPKIHGLLVQLPLPAHIDETEILREMCIRDRCCLCRACIQACDRCIRERSAGLLF